MIKIRFKSKGNWVTWFRIKCEKEDCKVDTGKRCHLSDAYEALMVMYYGADSDTVYKKEI